MTKQKLANKNLYANGLPFSAPGRDDEDYLENDIETWMSQYIAKQKPCIVIVCGAQGAGKTTLAVEIADEANKYVIDRDNKRVVDKLDHNPIDLEKQLALGGKDFRKKLDSAFVDGHQVVIYDEAGDYTNIGFATKFNRTMNQVFNMNRAFSALIIVVLPEVDELSKKVLRSTRGLIRCKDRQDNYSHFEAYDYETARYIVHYMKNRVVEEKVYGFCYEEYRGRFKDLSPKRSQLLDEYTMSGKRDIFHEQEIKEDNLHSTDEIADLCGRSKRWVQMKLKEKNFSHAKIYKSRKYYSQAVLDALLEEVKN